MRTLLIGLPCISRSFARIVIRRAGCIGNISIFIRDMTIYMAADSNVTLNFVTAEVNAIAPHEAGYRLTTACGGAEQMNALVLCSGAQPAGMSLSGGRGDRLSGPPGSAADQPLIRPSA